MRAEALPQAPPPRRPVAPVSAPPSPPASSPAGVTVGAPGPAVVCTITLSVGANVQGTLSQAAPGTVVCLNAGNYGQITLSGIAPSGNVTLAPAPGATVTFTDLTLTGAPSSNLTIQGFFIPGGVDDEIGHLGWARVPVQHDLAISRRAMGSTSTRAATATTTRSRPASRSCTTRSTMWANAWQSRAAPIKSERSRSPATSVVLASDTATPSPPSRATTSRSAA